MHKIFTSLHTPVLNDWGKNDFLSHALLTKSLLCGRSWRFGLFPRKSVEKYANHWVRPGSALSKATCWICWCHGNAAHVPLWIFIHRCPILIFHFFHTYFLSCSWLQNKSIPIVHLRPTDPGRERISSLSVFLGFRWTWEIAANNRIHGIHGSCEQNLSEATTALLAHQRDTFLEKLMGSHFPKKWCWNSKRRQEKTPENKDQGPRTEVQGQTCGTLSAKLGEIIKFQKHQPEKLIRGCNLAY